MSRGWRGARRSKTSGVCAALLGSAVVLTAIPPAHAAPACTPTQTDIGGAVVVQFLSTTTCDWVVPAGVTEFTAVLIVGGGGGGGFDIGGGGGAGGVVQLANVPVTPGATLTVTVGAGGVGNSNYATNPGSNGQDSSALGYTATGGGAGGSGGETGKNGGSGGGGGYGAHPETETGGTSTQSAPGVGNAGGSVPSGRNSGAGGGGAGGVGVNGGIGNSEQGGNGGAGIASSITGMSRFYAGGGGGGSQPAGTGTSGGSGVGGNGGRVSGPEIQVGDGAANTGSGGGGGGSGSSALVKVGGDGGSGIVIFRYASSTTPVSAQGEAPPPDWFQSTARDSATASCPSGWAPSWARWPNAGDGGWVCNRVVYWSAATGEWLTRPA